MEKSKIIRIIASIIISIGLWVYVINVVNPSSTTTVKNIPVRLLGTENLAEAGLAIEGSGEYTVDITVRAARTDLGIISADNFVASADASVLTMGQDFITVDVTAPKGYTVEDIRSRKIQVYVDELVSKTVPVVVEFASLESGYEAAAISVYPDNVEVHGAKQLVENVAEYVVPVDAGGFEEVQDIHTTGEFRNASGAKIAGVSSSTSDVEVKAAVYSIKTVALKVDYEGEPWEGARVKSINAPTSIKIKGPSSALTKVSELGTKKINIDGIFESAEFPISVKLPTGVYLAKENENPILKIDIDDNGSIEFSYTANEIKTTGLSSDLVTVYKLKEGGSIKATVTGPISVLKTLSASDITLSVDGSNFAVGTKDVKISASVQTSGINITLSPNQVSAITRKR